MAAPVDASAPEPALSEAEGWYTRNDWPPRVLYWTIHVACLLALWVGISTGDFLLFLATFLVRMFGITGGYHRYFAHRTYKTSRVFQFLLAVLGASATQKGPLWWAGHHRIHHRYSDVPGRDVHSPKDGVWWSHQAWIFDGRWDGTKLDQIRDFAVYPELVWLNRHYELPPLAVALLCAAIGGWSGLVWGFCVSTVALWHTTYAINSVCHLWGRRRYETTDTSRNNWLFGLLALGEGWHNNHHHYSSSARQGFRWWEIDVTYYTLRALQAVGVIWDVREPPAHVVRGEAAPQPIRAAA